MLFLLLLARLFHRETTVICAFSLTSGNVDILWQKGTNYLDRYGLRPDCPGVHRKKISQWALAIKVANAKH